MIALPRKAVLLLVLALMSTTAIGLGVNATPQTASFTYKNGFWYDSWGYTRNYAIGSNGFMPNLAYEVLGKWQDLAFDLGTQFAEKYPDKIKRAEAILEFVQQRTEYGYDEDNVIIGRVYQEEWAWNGDEMASKIDFVSNTPAIGDCEDLAFICSAIYEGAGFDTAMVLTTDHAALLIWLPDYPNVLKWDLDNDGRDYGWIWVESTGNNNPLGWTPDAYRDGDWEAYVIEQLYTHDIQFSPKKPTMGDDVTVTTSILHKTSDLDKIVLRYFLDGDKHEVNMEHVTTSKYKAIIPKQRDGTIIEFEVIAIEENGFSKESDLLSYQVGEGGFKLPSYLVNAGLIALILVILIVIFTAL